MCMLNIYSVCFEMCIPFKNSFSCCKRTAHRRTARERAVHVLPGISVFSRNGILISQFPIDAVQASGWPPPGADGIAKRACEFPGPRFIARGEEKGNVNIETRKIP